jgi:two-component sensor histidine kinase
MIRTYWRKTLNTGIREDNSFTESKKIKLVNELSSIILIVNIFTTIRWIVLNQPPLLLLNIAAVCSMLLVLYLNKTYNYKYAQLVFFGYIPLHLAVLSAFVPAGLEQYIFPLMIIAGFLIDKKRDLMIYLFFLGMLYLYIRGEFITLYYIPFERDAIDTINHLSSFLSLFMTLISINIFVKQYEINRHEVLIVNNMLEESVNIAKEKASYAELLLKEMNHRVKNNLQLITSLLNIQTQKVEGEHPKKALQDAKNRVYAIALIHEKLYNDGDIDTVNIADYLDSLIQNIKDSVPVVAPVTLDILGRCDTFRLSFRDAVSVGLILNEMINNAIIHGLSDIKSKKVVAEVIKIDEDRLQLAVTDNGSGLENIMESSRRGFGIELIETLSGSYEGKIFVDKELNKLIVELNFQKS